MSSGFIPNTAYFPYINTSTCSAATVSQFERVKLGEIYKIRGNTFEFTCSYCSQAFQNLDHFSLHVHEHTAGVVPSTVRPPGELTIGKSNSVNGKSSGIVNNTMEPYEMFFAIENKNDIGMVGHAHVGMARKDIGGERIKSNEPIHVLNDAIKTRLAEDNLATNEDSAEAAEYCHYLYDYRFRKTNGVFECPKCEYASEKCHDIRRHVFRHLTRPIFTCTICDEKLSSIRNHKEFHQRQNAKRVRYGSAWKGDEKSFRGINDELRTRLAKDNFDVDDSPEAQEYCKYMYDFKFNNTNGLYHCPKCEFTSDQNRYVKRHVFKHLHRNIFTCKLCNMKVSSFLRHREIHAKNRRLLRQQENSSQGGSSSESSGIFGRNDIDGSKHTFTEIDDRVKQRLAADNFELDDSPEAAEYSRYIFDYRFANVNGLFKCPKCDYTSDQNHHVRRHIFGHLNRQIFRCTVCNVKMSHISRFIEHKRLHRGNIERYALKTS